MNLALPLSGRLLVPLYVHPTGNPAAWRALHGRARRLHAVVLNAADGPGRRRDPAFHAVARDPRAAGVRLLGYVDTAYGRRSSRALLTDVLVTFAGDWASYQRARVPVDDRARAAADVPPGVRGAR
ncbi:hypothetical protein H8N00_02345 [Streptomyces sp. AC563]|uniref:spherulation-specific family 4 protein n=1 Tax=Streptomyces buecherae TaxID=2763006 RepID=UPI00164E72BB|nr:spherulation-specific family 4 protein [Streptomyces buecherae]MBC3987765.1 hypothetical protein [Streptomyces buecherae]